MSDSTSKHLAWCLESLMEVFPFRNSSLLALGGLVLSLSASGLWIRKRISKPAHVYPQRQRDSGEENKGKLFYGVRVIEIATHVAAPAVGRCMADLGAEVIKVEQPNGDFLRKFLLPLESPRKFSTWFEHTNCGKYSLKLDLKSSECIKQLKILLKDADVLIANVRAQSLMKLGLDYDSLKEEFPHLVYAHLSAWGSNGSLAASGGFDIGAFWTFSGMAAMTMEKERFRFYAGGSGDLTTGQMLFAGINMALFQRLKTGKGTKVDVSLMHAGAWCISPFIVKDQTQNLSDQIAPDYQRKPQPSAVDSFYETKDNVHVAICYKGSFADQDGACHELYTLLGVPLNEGSKDTVQSKVQLLTLHELEERLQGSRFLHLQRYMSVSDRWESLKAERSSKIPTQVESVVDFVDRLGVPDVPFLPRLPYEFSCASNHGPARRAPSMAEHTDCILQKGWLPCEGSAPLLPEQPDTNNSELPLHGITVLELTDLRNKHDVCIPAAAAMLAENGAEVFRYEGADQDPLQLTDPETYSLFNSDKELVAEPATVIPDVVLTDLSEAALEELGCSYEELRSRNPLVVFVHLKDGRKADVIGALSAAYVTSGCANIYAGATAVDIPTLPTHTLELMASAFILSATTAALFRVRRLQTIGEKVEVTYERLGLFVFQGMSVLMLRDPTIIRLLGSKSSKDNNHPVPSLVAHCTRDGMWVQLLETDMKKGLIGLANSLEIKKTLIATVVWRLLFGVLPKYLSNKHLPLDQIAEPAFVEVNRLIKEGIGKRDYLTLKQAFDRHGLSYTTVKMPAQLVNCDQYHANNVFKEVERKDTKHKHYHVTVPISLRS